MMRGTPDDIGTLHFIGIGGIGMSGIAEILATLGYKIQGSDLADSANVKRLREKGIQISIGHNAANISGAAAVVISSAMRMKRQPHPLRPAAVQASSAMAAIELSGVVKRFGRLRRSMASTSISISYSSSSQWSTVVNRPSARRVRGRRRVAR